MKSSDHIIESKLEFVVIFRLLLCVESKQERKVKQEKKVSVMVVSNNHEQGIVGNWVQSASPFPASSSIRVCFVIWANCRFLICDFH